MASAGALEAKVLAATLAVTGRARRERAVLLATESMLAVLCYGGAALAWEKSGVRAINLSSRTAQQRQRAAGSGGLSGRGRDSRLGKGEAGLGEAKLQQDVYSSDGL